MRVVCISLLLIACGPKEAPAPAAEAAATTAAAPAPAEEAEPEEAPEPEPVAPSKNVDLNMTITRADGSTASGHVSLIQRSDDWFGETDWVSDQLTISGETSSDYKKIPWTEVKSITVKAGRLPDDVDCIYDSNWSPWMYDCTIKNEATLIDKAGTRWTVDQRHKWKVTFDNGEAVEFWLNKHPAREQDEQKVNLDTIDAQNYDLYTKLQHRLREEMKTSMVVKVTVD